MYRRFGKRLLDIIISLVAIPFILLVTLIIAPLIWLEDKGSIFYNAPRLGKDGIQFNMYKFRSMKMDASDIRNEDGSTYNAENDPRVTKIGRLLRKTSLDELPQFFNVLKGDMSLVGPRPDPPYALTEIYQGNESRRMSVQPGLTGYSQAYFRNAIELHERIKLDIAYVDNISFMLDMKVLIKTVQMVLSRKSVFRNDEEVDPSPDTINDSHHGERS